MSAIAETVALPIRRDGRGKARARRAAPRLVERVPLGQRAVIELATADDVASGAAAVTAMVRRDTGAARVEWWAPADDGLELVAEAGHGSGSSQDVPLGRGGVLVVFGGLLDSALASALAPLMPILRRRRAEERLAQTAVRLARSNEALEDFAALVAHELKTPLQAALVAGDASSPLEQALDLVDALLEAARSGQCEQTYSSAAECLEAAARDLPTDVEITGNLGHDAAGPARATSRRPPKPAR